MLRRRTCPEQLIDDGDTRSARRRDDLRGDTLQRVGVGHVSADGLDLTPVQRVGVTTFVETPLDAAPVVPLGSGADVAYFLAPVFG
jgi:hypothetical protein